MKNTILILSIAFYLNANAQTYPLVENFDTITTSTVTGTGPLPSGWTTTNEFQVYANHCATVPNGCSVEMNNANKNDTLITPFAGPLNANTNFSFDYRFVYANNYPNTGATLHTGDKVNIEMNIPGGNWTLFATIDSISNPTPLTTWTSYTYACNICGIFSTMQMRLSVSRATANSDWYFDIDNFYVGNFTPTGISRYSNYGDLVNTYPNPTTGKFTIETNTSEEQTLQVFDLNGRKVLSQNIFGKTEIDAKNLNDGVYNLTIKSSIGTVYKKLIVIH